MFSIDTSKLTEKNTMRPYSLVTVYCNALGIRMESLSSKKAYYFVRAKQILKHLRELNWTDNDISFFMYKLVDGLRRDNCPTTFPYISSILLSVKQLPQVETIEVDDRNIPPDLKTWLENEINNLKTNKS